MSEENENPVEDKSIEKKPIEEKSEYDSLDYSDDVLQPVVENEYDLKRHIITSSFREKDVLKLQDLMVKELTLSNIPDTQLASIYAGKMDCVASYAGMKWFLVASSRLGNVMFRLQLLRSVGSNDNWGQYGQMSTTATIEREPIERYAQPEEVQEKRSSPLPKIMSVIRKKR